MVPVKAQKAVLWKCLLFCHSMKHYNLHSKQESGSVWFEVNKWEKLWFARCQQYAYPCSILENEPAPGMEDKGWHGLHLVARWRAPLCEAQLQQDANWQSLSLSHHRGKAVLWVRALGSATDCHPHTVLLRVPAEKLAKRKPRGDIDCEDSEEGIKETGLQDYMSAGAGASHTGSTTGATGDLVLGTCPLKAGSKQMLELHVQALD